MWFNPTCFDPGEWMNNEALRSCSLAARGLSVHLYWLMREFDQYGYLTYPAGAKDLGIETPADLVRHLARFIESSEKEVVELLAELEGAGVLSRTDEGIIYSPQMLEEAEELRAAGLEACVLCADCCCCPIEDEGQPQSTS